MTSRERVRAVFAHRMPDRVPMYEVLIGADMVFDVLGIKGADSWALSPEDRVRLAEALGHDAIVFPFVYKPRKQFTNVYVDLDKLTFPEEWFAPKFALYQQVAACARDAGLAVIPYTHGCFDLPYEVMGYEHYMISLADAFDYVDQLTEYFCEVGCTIMRRAMEPRPDAVFFADDLCYNSGLMISESWFMKLWYAREARMVALCKNAGFPVEFHTDGKLDPVIESIIGMGIDLINPIDANCNDIFAVKEKYGNRIAIRGNVNVSGPLYYGPRQAVYEEAKEKLLRLKPGGNYVLSSSHSITPGMRYENFKGMLDALQEFGAY